MRDAYPKLRVGVVQAASVFLNRSETVEKALSYIEQAGREQHDLLAFPEGFIPGHPVWYNFYPATAPRSVHFATQLLKNAISIPGPETDALCEVAARWNVHVVMGVCERPPGNTGTMYNTLLFIDRRGHILGKHQKLVPTVGERLVHTGGFGDGLTVYDTDIGKIGGLICGENANPLAVFALAAQGIQIHIVNWPNHFSRNVKSMADNVTFISRALAYSSSCFVLNACAVVSEEMREMMPVTDEDRAFLSDPEIGGGSSIIGPNGEILAGPMSGTEEGILSASIDLASCVRGKLVRDFTGHYNRADVFTLTINKSVPDLVRFHGGPYYSETIESAEGEDRPPTIRPSPVDISSVVACTDAEESSVRTRTDNIKDNE